MTASDELLGEPPATDAFERAQIIAAASSKLLGTPPPTIDRFEIRARLGGGATGSVWAAWDPRLERDVAIKVLRDDVATSEALVAEARAMARLSHPNVVTVHEVVVADDRVLLVMERIHGRSLATWIADGEHTWREIVATFAAAGRGLAAAHHAGIVHRDFKPANVLIRESPLGVAADGRVLVTDFGLAVVAATPTDAVVGTLAYMAPEQHARETLGPATDQFAFCVALYEALFGGRPFAGSDGDALALAKTEGRIIAPPRSSTAPPWLRTAIERGLAPTASERWPSMDMLVEVLASDPARQRLRRLGIVAIVVVALIATIGATMQMIVFWDWYRRAGQ